MLARLIGLLRPAKDDKGRPLTLQQRLLLRLERLVAHRQNPSGNNMSQR